MWHSVVIKGETDWCLVKVNDYGFNLTSQQIHFLASSEAEEYEILPTGHKLIYKVVDQEEMLYYRLWTPEFTQVLKEQNIAVR